MNGDTFVDTNILIYAHDLDAGERRTQAASLLRDLWEEGRGIISTQVLQEFFVNVTAKIPSPLSLQEAREMLRVYGAWQVEKSDVETVISATEIQERNRISFWDAMIVPAACQVGAVTLLSEELNHGQIIEGVRVTNPFV